MTMYTEEPEEEDEEIWWDEDEVPQMSEEENELGDEYEREWEKEGEDQV